MDEFKISLSTADGKKDVLVRIKSRPRTRNFNMWINSDGEITLSKPSYTPKSEAVEFIKSNVGWLENQLRNWKPKTPVSVWLAENPKIYADAKEWKVWLRPESTTPFTVEDNLKSEVVFAFNSEESLKLLIVKFATERLTAAARRVADAAGLSFKRLSIRDQGGRWASMSTTGTLSLNWRTIFLPEELQTYILSHELAHTVFMNHSVSFWIFLNKICPGAKKLDKKLSDMSGRIFSIC